MHAKLGKMAAFRRWFASISVLLVAEEGQLDASKGPLAHHVKAC